MHMNTLRWFELWFGIGAGAFGLLGLAGALFYPSGIYGSCNASGGCSYRVASLVQRGMSPDGWFTMSILCLCLLAVIVSAILHSTLRQGAWLVILWFAVSFVLLFAFLAIFTIGPFIAPAALLSLVAAGLGTRVQVAKPAWG